MHDDSPTLLKIIATLDGRSAVGIGTEPEAIRAFKESAKSFVGEPALAALCRDIRDVIKTSGYVHEMIFEHDRWHVHIYWGAHVPLDLDPLPSPPSPDRR